MSRSRQAAIPATLLACLPRVTPRVTRLLLALLVSAGVSSCARSPDPRQAQQRAAELQRRNQQIRCRRDREQLPPLVEGLRRTESKVAAIEAQAYVPSAAPAPLDPEEQRRLAIYDQEIEQEQYDQAYAAWQDREAQRRAAWRSDRRERLSRAREQRAAAAAALQAQAPDLLRATDPPQLDQDVLQRRLSCGAVPR